MRQCFLTDLQFHCAFLVSYLKVKFPFTLHNSADCSKLVTPHTFFFPQVFKMYKIYSFGQAVFFERTSLGSGLIVVPWAINNETQPNSKR